MTSLKDLPPRWFRPLFNLWPCMRGTGMRAAHIADDWSEVRVRLPLTWRTRNYVGTIFGGSMYAATDPFLMIMFMKRLGTGYVVWDKAGSIRYRRPASTTLHATFTVDDDELAAVRSQVDELGEVERTYTVDLVDGDGAVYASVEKLLYFATREAYEAKQLARRSRAADAVPT